MQRRLATIQRIKNKKDVENSDRLAEYTVLGWNCVAGRSDFNTGDLVVYFECDSILPEKECFEFLRSKKYRIKTCRFRGALSQGLIMPLSILETLGTGIPGELIAEGHDVTELLGIKKYEVPLPLGSDAIGPFPHFIPKTDELRIQAIVPQIFDEIDGKELYITVKVDGTSGTFYCNDGKFGVCSRNLEIKDGNNPYWSVAKKYDLQNKLCSYPDNIAVQGEVCGPGIQKNRLKLTEYKLFVFSVYNITNRRFLNYNEFIDFTNELHLNRVPFMTERLVFDKNAHSLYWLLEIAKGKYVGTDNDREGIVIRSIVECRSEVLDGRLSFKVLNNDYLEKER